MWCLTRCLVRLVILALVVVEPVQALQLRTPHKWNVNAQNVLVWTPEMGDPTRFNAYLRHPVYLPKLGLALLSSVTTNDSGSWVRLPTLKTSKRYFVVAMSVGSEPRMIAQTGNFTIVTDDSEPEHYTYSFANPHNLSPSQTDAESTSATTTSKSGRPSLSYNSAQGRTSRPWSWLLSVCMFGWIVVA